MRHIHTSIVSRHLATRGNNKILRTPPPHTSSSEEILPRLTCRILVQLRTNKSPFFKSYLHKIDSKTHPSPLFPLCNTQIHNTHHLFNWWRQQEHSVKTPKTDYCNFHMEILYVNIYKIETNSMNIL